MYFAYVPVEQAHTFGSFPYCFRVVKILARCQQPGYLHHFGNRSLAVLSETNWIALTCIASSLTQTVIECTRLQCRGCHSLSVNGIKTASSIAEDHQALGKARHLLIVTSLTRGKLVGNYGRYRLCILDCLVEIRHLQAFSIVEKSLFVMWWVVSQPADQCHNPTVVFDGNHVPP